MMRRRRFTSLQALAALTGLLLAVACAVAPPPPRPPAPAPAAPPQPRPAPAAVIPIAAPPPPSAFEQFLDAMHSAARAQGIREETFAAATAGLAPIPAIIDANENQPEFSRPVWAYLDSAVSARRIK
ncbi:MAG TPA: lytic murein transglycosylase, partial [Rhizomicrobium sp.]|nr:lytic murein transglycosylase [Rhizomicrobium sp.]